MDFDALAMGLPLVWKVVAFVTFVTNKQVNAIVTQVVTWVAGIGVMTLIAATDFASGIGIGDQTLDSVNGASLVLIGMTVASWSSVAYDFKRAFDVSDTARQPKMLPRAAAKDAIRDPII